MNADLPRRQVLRGLTLAGVPIRGSAGGTSLDRVRPGEPGWPDAEQWASLESAVAGRFGQVTMPRLDSAAAAGLLSNPFFLREQPGLTQSSGWLDAWRSAPSAYCVRASNPADVSAAVRFAARHRLRLVVKGAGHSYLGGSNASDSLLIWTRDMQAITVHHGFVPQSATTAPVAAVSVGAGCIWLDVYNAVTTHGGRYVQGGGCTTVGVAGLVLGGGFGSLSKAFGLAAAHLLEAEIVTADGVVRTVNAAQGADLFWALKGGGGGSFGVVTRLTLRTHELPATVGLVHWVVQARSDTAFAELLGRFIDLYARQLCNPHWGEQASARPNNRLDVTMVFQGLDEATARAGWSDLVAFVTARPHDYQIIDPLLVAAIDSRHLWDEDVLRAHLPGILTQDGRPDARHGDWWWSSNTGEAGSFWHAYESAWLPASLLAPGARGRLAQAWFDASRKWSVALHFNKGLAGAPEPAIAASRDTAMNPQVLDAFALAIIADHAPPAFPGAAEPDMEAARAGAVRVRGAMGALRQAAPEAGSYVSECDYALSDWQHACWGEHRTRLTEVKRRYDPDGLFFVHHGIGSELWSSDGFTRTG